MSAKFVSKNPNYTPDENIIVPKIYKLESHVLIISQKLNLSEDRHENLIAQSWNFWYFLLVRTVADWTSWYAYRIVFKVF